MRITGQIVIQNITVSLLFHIVPHNLITEAVIIGKDLLDNGVLVQIDSDKITFSLQKEVNVTEKPLYPDFNSIDTDLHGENKEALVQILRKYSEFFIDGIPTRRVTTGVMRIDPIDPNMTVYRRPYRLSPVEKEIVQEKVDALLKAGVIRESSSPFASPILFVKKKTIQIGCA